MTAKLKWLFALGFVLVFIAGVATGVFAGAWRAKHHHVTRHQGPPPRMTERMIERFERELHLTPEQVAQTRPIFEDTARKLSAIREETGRRVAATLEESHQQMAPHLTPEQQEQLKEMKLRHRHILKMKRKHRRERRERAESGERNGDQ
ncbi:hypothetical protein BH20VER2_BH20VER2_09970 [soil metagenome]|nr:hypothetical protein [Chthoniobacterales bacterium]